MNYGLVMKWDAVSQEVTLVSGSPIYQKSVAVHTVTLLASLPEGNLVTATFGTYDSVSSAYKPITEPINMGLIGINAYECAVPDLVLQSNGTYVISFTILTPIVANGAVRYKVLTTGVAQFTVNASVAQLVQTPIPQSVADNLQSQINRLVRLEGILQPPDNTAANLVGTANVEIKEDGRLKFNYLKGEKGDTGSVQWGVNAPSPKSTIKWTIY